MAVDWGLGGHVTVVTGASRGLGEAAVRAMVAEGARVVAAARSVDALDALARELGDAVVAVPCDMRDRDAVAGLVDEAVSRFGRLDSVVNNAGIAPASKFVDQPDDVFDEVLAVNLAAPAALAVASSPSGCEKHWPPAGAHITGKLIRWPSTVVASAPRTPRAYLVSGTS